MNEITFGSTVKTYQKVVFGTFGLLILLIILGVLFL